MSRRVLFLGFLLASLVSTSAAPPAWWASRGATDTNPPNDDSAVNQGQLVTIQLQDVVFQKDYLMHVDI